MGRAWARYQAQGAVTLDVAGSGTQTPAEYDVSAPVVLCSGALTGDKVIELPAIEGWGTVLVNRSSGAYLQAFRAAGGSRLVYVLPYQSKRVWVEGGELYAVDEQALLARLEVSLIGGAGTVDTRILRLPPTATLTRLLLRGMDAVVGGATTFQAGLTSGGDELLLSASAPAAGVLVGETSGWGGSMPSGASYDGGASAFDVYLRVTRAAPVTAGKVAVYAMGSHTP